jgi:polysaccharide export outer membrane protein
MTSIHHRLLSILLLPSLAVGLAQPPSDKPAPTLAPATAPATPPAEAAPKPPAPAPVPAPSIVDANYIIGADDSIQISVWGESNLSTTLPVRPDGKVSLPLLGDITAAGFTPMQLASNIAAHLTQYIDDPVVNVSVLAVNSKRIYLVGEVMHVGPVSLTPGMNILQAIASAGGLTPYASKKRIYILRGELGLQKRVPFDYNRAVRQGDMQGITLVPGDTIVIP